MGQCYDNPFGNIEITYKAESLKTKVYRLIVDLGGAATCGELAEELDTSRSSVSRAAKELSTEGTITINKRRYQVA